MNIFHRIVFASFLEEEEKIKKVFRHPFLFLFKRVLFCLILWGSLTFLVWFFVPYINGIPIWWFVVAFLVFKVFSAFFFWYINAILMTTESLLFIDWPRSKT